MKVYKILNMHICTHSIYHISYRLELTGEMAEKCTKRNKFIQVSFSNTVRPLLISIPALMICVELC